MPGLHVTVEFDDVGDYATHYYHRSVTLQGPHWDTPIGRSTATHNGPTESADNCWFNSRVVSRVHARLKADPITRTVTIEDVGSMHGTHVEDRRLVPGQSTTLFDGARVTFGAEVERVGSEGSTQTFKPIQTRVWFSWSDGLDNHDTSRASAPAAQSHNSFTADYSDDDLSALSEADDGPEEPRSRIRSPSLVQPTAAAFKVPSSVSEDNISISDEDESIIEHYSPDSSPVEPHGSPSKVTQTKSPSVTTRNAQAAEPEMPNTDVSDDESYYENSSIFDGGEDDEVDEVLQEAQVEHPPQPSQSIGDSLNRVVPPPAEPVVPAGFLSPPPLRPPPSRALPSIHEFDYGGPSYSPFQLSTPFNSTERNESSWAGYNSVLYDPPPVNQYAPVYGRREGNMSPVTYQWTHNPAPSLSLPRLHHISHSTTTFPNETTCSYIAPPWSDVNQSLPSINDIVPKLPGSPTNTRIGATKITVTSTESKAPTTDNITPTRKRKADAVASEESTSSEQAESKKPEATTVGQGGCRTDVHVSRVSAKPLPKAYQAEDRIMVTEEDLDLPCITAEQVNVAASPESLDHNSDSVDVTQEPDLLPKIDKAAVEPPRKKMKTTQAESVPARTTEAPARGYGKLIAAMGGVTAGVAIGAVGTVAALCALPASYFA